ncbi:MAG TPA: hypothetical protein VMB03_12120 [Bryobacteraceae bacterium]|nr:hypothetical protein [Bryobacteraceae bacterium]
MAPASKPAMVTLPVTPVTIENPKIHLAVGLAQFRATASSNSSRARLVTIHACGYNLGMRNEELDRRCAEIKARMLAQWARSGLSHNVAVKSEVRPAPKQLPAPAEIDPEIFRIEKAHPLIAATKRVLRERSHSGPLVHLGGTESLDISVGKNSAPRALWFMQQLIKKSETAGISISVSLKYPTATSCLTTSRRGRAFRGSTPPSTRLPREG